MGSLKNNNPNGGVGKMTLAERLATRHQTLKISTVTASLDRSGDFMAWLDADPATKQAGQRRGAP